ncbi:4-hydroxy-tetrahydrodipicolinate synthase [Streptacidiphilus sp. PB12-B1b]|uniref:4-hydroxy-tetrahydrodipicolinate synthase n=1 Tax=Streptacidiphilus sp. PB12-B1b TaxID=2705012 RepID=UPI0015FD1BCF|nr:4-hydroxy-tetrahydrodipicolinate synthase [Streptacidiphilus sp. PB12-B1b]QMU78732.1 4-hydroxy-tetrahydrodipicolinate synthase [Streptacidiphilus sp. PB12-B1b]
MQLPFGRVAAAMVTPFRPDGALDADGAQRLAAHLVDSGCDGLVLNATTGEGPTTTDAEKDALLRAVLEAVGDRAAVTAGVGSNDTRHTLELARAAERAGADGLLVVTPYYNRPGQEGIRSHLAEAADATGLPVMLYDIPARTGSRLSRDTLLRLAEHPRVAGVKDAAYDLLGSARVIAETGLHYYSGADELNLPLYAVGAVGAVSTVANVAPGGTRAVLEAHARGDNAAALALHQRLLPLIEAMMTTDPGTVTAKALLRRLGLPGGPVRRPLLDAGPELAAALAGALTAALPDTAPHEAALPEAAAR